MEQEIADLKEELQKQFEKEQKELQKQVHKEIAEVGKRLGKLEKDGKQVKEMLTGIYEML